MSSSSVQKPCSPLEGGWSDTNFELSQYTLLNGQGLDLVSARDFYPITSCTDPRVRGFTSHDPRLADVLRGGDHLILDRPALQPRGVQPLQDVYLPENTSGIGPQTYFGGYKDVRGGNYSYYVDSDLEVPYNTPVYAIPVDTRPFVLVDPMGGRKPYYDRMDIGMHNNQLSSYTFDQDQMKFREDLTSKQSQKMYSRDYSYYHHYFFFPS